MNILIVDDETYYFTIVSQSIKQLGDLQIFTAENLGDAKTKLDENNIDIVITDMSMNTKADGFYLLEYSKKKFPNQIVIIFTSGRHGLQREDIIKAGAFDYILKSELNFNNIIKQVTHSAIEKYNALHKDGDCYDFVDQSGCAVIDRNHPQFLEKAKGKGNSFFGGCGIICLSIVRFVKSSLTHLNTDLIKY